MNTIKVYLDSSGRIATLKKDFPLYQGQFQNVLLNIYVPTAILSSDYEIQHYIGKTTFESAPTKEELDAYVLQQTSKTASEGDTIYVTIGNNFYLYVFNGTAYDATEVSKFPPVTTGTTTINVGTIAVQRNGALYKSKTYPTRYIKTFQFEGIDYALYERKLPKTFVALDGFGDNAPKMIINVVNIDKANNGLESLITSQTCRLEVLPSTILDRDEIIEPSVLDEINATLNNLSDKKQDKQIDNATTDNKTVLGAINELDANGKANATNIQSANEAINKVSEDLEKLSQYVGTGEFFVGTMESETIPTGEQVSAFVQETLSRPAKNNDVVIVVVDTASTHPMTYKYRFNGTEWGHYLIPTVEPATNEEWGSIRGSFGDTTGSTQVNVVGGVIKQVLTKKKNGAYEDVAQSIYGQELMTERIVNGETIVGKSAYAFSDGEGNPITETYLNKYVGATKEYVHDFALPNTFNDVHYLNFVNGEDRYLNTLGEETKVVKVTGIGEKVLLNARYELNEKFQLSGNNNYNTTFFLQADIPENAYFKLKTYAHKLGEEKKLVAQQILPPQDVTGIVQLSFNSNLNVIPYDVIKLRESDRIIQELTIVRSVSNEANISIFSNSTLASTFYLTTVGKTVVHESAEKGEIDVIRTELPVLDRDSYVADFSLPDTISLHEFAEYMFEIPFTNPLEERTLIYLRDVATDTTYAIQTPYDVGTATTKLLEQTKSADNVYRFVAVLKNGKFVVEQSNLSFVKVDVSDKVDKVGQQEQVYATDGLGNQTSLPYNVTPYGGGIAQRTGDGRLKATNGTENNDLATIEQLSEKQPNIGLYVQGKVYPRNAVVSYSGELYRSLRDENPDEITAPSWQKITSVGESGLRPLGSVAYENLPKVPNIYWFKAMWNISNDFVTDDRFLEGAGKKHKAGTNVACVEDTTNVYKYDVIGSFIDLTDYFTKGEVTALTEANADLIASTQADVSVNSGNIQTINDHIDAGGFLQTTQQQLTPEQKAQALKNANIVLSEKTTEHTEEIGHDSATGKLYSKTPIASADKVGGVKVGENLEITADGTLNAKGGGGIVPVEALPTASKEEYDKHLLYLQGGDLKYMAEMINSTPSVSLLSQTLPQTENCPKSVLYNDFIYFFLYNKLVKFNPTTFEITSQNITDTLSGIYYTKLVLRDGIAYGVNDKEVNDGVRIHRGVINSYNLETGAYKGIIEKFPNYIGSIELVNNKIYNIGGEERNKDDPSRFFISDKICTYNFATGSIATESAKLPVALSRTITATIGTDIYIMGGMNENYGGADTIYKFDTTNNTITTLDYKLQEPVRNSTAVVMGNNIIVMGGEWYNPFKAKWNDNKGTQIIDISTGTVTTSVNLIEVASHPTAQRYGSDIFLCGGTSDVDSDKISKISFGKTYKYKTITAV